MGKMDLLQHVPQDSMQLNRHEVEWIILSILHLDIVSHPERYSSIFGLMVDTKITITPENVKHLRLGDELIPIKKKYSSEEEADLLVKILKDRDIQNTIKFLTLYLKTSIIRIKPICQQNILNIVINSVIGNLLTMQILMNVCGYDEAIAKLFFISPKSDHEFSMQVYNKLQIKGKNHGEINKELTHLFKEIEPFLPDNNLIIRILRCINSHYIFVYLYLALKNNDGSLEVEDKLSFNFSDDDINRVLSIYCMPAISSLFKGNGDRVNSAISSILETLNSISPNNMVWLDESTIPEEYLYAYKKIKQEIQKEQEKRHQGSGYDGAGRPFTMTMLNGIQQQN